MQDIWEGLYELKHKHGSFTDFETNLVINRNQQVEVQEPIGAATRTAIQSGRLLYVRETKKQAAKVEKEEAKK